MEDSATQGNYWKKCSICKKEISFSSTYYVCSVSTCQRLRTGFTFCSTQCWDAHLGYVRHREAYAEEAVAPSKEEYAQASSRESESDDSGRPKRRIIVEQPRYAKEAAAGSSTRRDVDTLVVVSKVKQFVRSEAGLNTSQCAIDALTQKVVQACLSGIERAKEAERKTLMGRDLV